MKSQQTIERDALGRIAKGANLSSGTEFKPNRQPWNKGKRGYMGANATSFKPGNIPHTQNPKGTVSIFSRPTKYSREYLYVINIDWHGNRKPHNSYKWYLWEVEHQQDRPSGYVLAIKNGNPEDMRVANFELITRAENCRRNTQKKSKNLLTSQQ